MDTAGWRHAPCKAKASVALTTSSKRSSQPRVPTFEETPYSVSGTNAALLSELGSWSFLQVALGSWAGTTGRFWLLCPE